jgi:hypothetical protein
MKNSPEQMELASLNGKNLLATFSEPCVTSDAGVLLLRQVELETRLLQQMAPLLRDPRRQSHVQHTMLELLTQRVFQICCGYEDCNDGDTLKSDPAFMIAAERDPLESQLASQPTLSRLENSISRKDLVRIARLFVDHFLSSFDAPPPMIVLDMDPTADTVYGEQQLRFFNAFEDEYCFMPFHVYEGLSGKLITTVLRPGKTPTASEIKSILKRLIKRIRARWPNTRIVFRADSHHTKPEVMDWLEENAVEFATGLQANSTLKKLFGETIAQAEKRYKRWGEPVRLFSSASYAAKSWKGERRVICRVLVSSQGTDTRYIVTSFEHSAEKFLYEVIYSGRGRMELMIKDHKCGLHSDRTSCNSPLANQFRLFLHSAAYVLMHRLREKALAGTELAKAEFGTIRLKLLKIGARVEVLKTRIRFHLGKSYPLQQTFALALQRLSAFSPA